MRQVLAVNDLRRSFARVENKANLLRNAEGAEFVVMTAIEQYRVPALFKEHLLGEWNCVLPSKYLVEIMN